MFYDNELSFLQKILNNCHLKNQVLALKDSIYGKIDNIFTKLINEKTHNKALFDFFPDISSNTIYRITDTFLCRYIFLKLPTANEETVLAIGPYLNTDISQQQILELSEKIGLSPKLAKELELFYISLPVIKEENNIFAMINTFGEFIWNGSNNFDIIDINREISLELLSGSFEAKSDPEENMLNIQNMEKRYSYENELITAISQGKTHKAELMMANFSTLAFEKRTPDQLRNMKNYCIIMNTLFRKAAETGGVHPIYLDSVSSNFAKRIEAIHSLNNIPVFMIEILRTYCRLVKQHSIKNHSHLVQKALVKIESDLTCDLSLREMAKISNVSPGYFSALFKKETGQTLTQYVNNKRIKLAKHLLKTTNLQVQTIAQHCGILDLHYFCRVFKSIVGKTPTEYKESNSFN